MGLKGQQGQLERLQIIYHLANLILLMTKTTIWKPLDTQIKHIMEASEAAIWFKCCTEIDQDVESSKSPVCIETKIWITRTQTKFLEKSQQLLYSALYFEYKSIVMDSKHIFQRLGSIKQKGCNFLTNLVRARHNSRSKWKRLAYYIYRLGHAPRPSERGPRKIVDPLIDSLKSDLAMKLCISLFYWQVARATSEITKDIHVQSHARRRLRYACAATRRFNILYG